MTFPYTGWVLMPSFKPKQEQFLEHARQSNWHVTDKKKPVHIGDIHPSKQAAIAVGHARLQQQQNDLDKKQANINKRRAALEKAAGEAKP